LTTSILLEVEGRVILVTDKPGIGKSTLLTHLAKQTKERHPDIWIERVNINNYAMILNEFKPNGSEVTWAKKLLIEAAKVKETGVLNMKRCLFNICCSSTGNMAD
jgi:ABC-type lipoprotein export system ATPase subunit